MSGCSRFRAALMRHCSCLQETSICEPPKDRIDSDVVPIDSVCVRIRPRALDRLDHKGLIDVPLMVRMPGRAPRRSQESAGSGTLRSLFWKRQFS